MDLYIEHPACCAVARNEGGDEGLNLPKRESRWGRCWVLCVWEGVGNGLVVGWGRGSGGGWWVER